MYLHTDALRIFEHNLMQFASMSIEHRTCFVARWVLLVYDNLASVELVYVEAIVLEVDGNFAHRGCNRAIGPAVEDASGVGTERNDIAEDLKGWEGFVDDGCVTLSDAFYGCCEAAETW